MVKSKYNQLPVACALQSCSHSENRPDIAETENAMLLQALRAACISFHPHLFPPRHMPTQAPTWL
jgi:hypothetical protein